MTTPTPPSLPVPDAEVWMHAEVLARAHSDDAEVLLADMGDDERDRWLRVGRVSVGAPRPAARDARLAQVPDGLTADVTPDGAWFVSDANGLAWATPRESDEATARLIADAVNAYRRPEPTPDGEQPDLDAPDAVARLLADKVADDVESAVRCARDDVRCLDCGVRFEERRTYSCGEPGRGHDAGFPEFMLREAEDEARREDREYVTLSVAVLRAAIEQDAARAHRADDSRVVREAGAKALRDAADEQERLATGPRAMGSKAVEFKRRLFAQWLRERADILAAGGTETTGADRG